MKKKALDNNIKCLYDFGIRRDLLKQLQIVATIRMTNIFDYIIIKNFYLLRVHRTKSKKKKKTECICYKNYKVKTHTQNG